MRRCVVSYASWEGKMCSVVVHAQSLFEAARTGANLLCQWPYTQNQVIEVRSGVDVWLVRGKQHAPWWDDAPEKYLVDNRSFDAEGYGRSLRTICDPDLIKLGKLLRDRAATEREIWQPRLELARAEWCDRNRWRWRK
jgi:hypothetical protein